MPSIEHALMKAKEMGVNMEQIRHRSRPYSPPTTHEPNSLTPESAFSHAKDGVDYFSKYWSQEMKRCDEIQTATGYVEKVNCIYENYVAVRRNLDGSVAYVIGDWLNACRKKFFPGEDRKTASDWRRFLDQNLCTSFSRASAYLYMRIAEKLEPLRNSKVPLQKLEALARLVDTGTDILPILSRTEELSVADIRAFRQKEEKEEKGHLIVAKIAACIASARVGMEKINVSNYRIQEEQLRSLQVDLNSILLLLEANKS